jgi:hypothetical protein
MARYIRQVHIAPELVREMEFAANLARSVLSRLMARESAVLLGPA